MAGKGRQPSKIGPTPPGGPSGAPRPNGLCEALTRAGAPCKGTPLPGLSVCIAHSKAHRESLREAGRKGGCLGGRGRARKGSAELRELRVRLSALSDGVEAGEVLPAVAHAAAALANASIRAVEVERKIHDAEELAKRIEILEDAEKAASASGVRRRW